MNHCPTPASPTSRRRTLVAIFFASVALAACGGGGDSKPTPPPPPPPPPPAVASYTIGGTVTGLAGSGLVLQDNAGDDKAISANGSFTFAVQLEQGKAYSVTVKAQPVNPAQTCTVAGGSGTVTTGNVTSVAITCATNDTDMRPLDLSLNTGPQGVTNMLIPYLAQDSHNIPLTSVTWYFDGTVGGLALPGAPNRGVFQIWRTPGTHTIRAVGHASNNRSAEVSVTLTVVNAPLVSGTFHSCAMTPSRGLKCWGSNTLGDGAPPGSGYTPVDVAGLRGVWGVALGDNHSCAIKSDRSVACWGDNSLGALGNAATFRGSSNTPVSVDGLGNVVALSAGERYTCALKADGSVVCFGDNNMGQLSTVVTGDFTVTPTPVAGLSKVVAIAAAGTNGNHTCALKADTTVVCWGANFNGQLGTGSSTPDHIGTPQTVMRDNGMPLDHVLVIGGGAGHNCAIVDDSNYSVYCWGSHTFSQTASGNNSSSAAVKVAGLSNTFALMVGGLNTCSIDYSDPSGWASFKCWGENSFGQASGDGSSGFALETPTAVPPFKELDLPEFASVGHEYVCALTANGQAKCFGRGNNGELGDGGTSHSPTPVTVSTPAGTFWTWASP